MEDLHIGKQSQLRRFGFELAAERIDFASKTGDAVLQFLPIAGSDARSFAWNGANLVRQIVGGSICQGRKCEKDGER